LLADLAAPSLVLARRTEVMPCGQARIDIEGSGQVPQWASAVLVPSFLQHQPRPSQGHSRAGRPGSLGSGVFEH